MFNFYAVLTGHDKVTDADRATRCRRKFKAPSLQKHSTKKRPSENMSFNVKTFEDFRQKTLKYTSSVDQTTSREARLLKTTIEDGPCNQEEINRRNVEKSFRSELLELCKTRTKKSSPDMFIFYVTSIGHDMVTDAGRATSCRCKFRNPLLQTKVQKKMDLPKTWVLTGESLKISYEEKIKYI